MIDVMKDFTSEIDFRSIHLDVLEQLKSESCAKIMIPDLSQEDFLEISYLFGEVIPPGRDCSLVTDIFTTDKEGELEVKLHNDKSYWRVPPKYILLYMSDVKNMTGGDVLVSDLFSSYNLLNDDCKKILKETNVSLSHPKNRDQGQLQGKLINELNGELSFVRYRTDLISGVSEAVAKWQEQLYRAKQEVSLTVGDLLILDNWKIAHGRKSTCFESDGYRRVYRSLVI